MTANAIAFTHALYCARQLQVLALLQVRSLAAGARSAAPAAPLDLQPAPAARRRRRRARARDPGADRQAPRLLRREALDRGLQALARAAWPSRARRSWRAGPHEEGRRRAARVHARLGVRRPAAR